MYVTGGPATVPISSLSPGDGRRLLIGPGMTADVNLLGDRRTVMAYIMTPGLHHDPLHLPQRERFPRIAKRVTLLVSAIL